MASVYPRGRRWWVGYRDPKSGERVLEPLGRDVKTRVQAKAAGRAIERDIEERREGPAGFARLEDVVEDFVDAKKKKRERWTWISYRKHLRPLVARHGSSPISEITDAQLDAHLAARIAAKTIKKITANKELVTFRVFWAWACKHRKTRENPAMLVDPYSVRATPRKPPSEAQLDEAVADLRSEAAEKSTRPWTTHAGDKRQRLARPEDRHAAGLYADVLELASWTGARPGELCRIDLAEDDVDLEAATVRLRSAPNKGPRTVPLVGAALAIVRARVAWRARFAADAEAAREPAPDTHLLLTHEGRHAERALNLFGRGWRKRKPKFKPVVPHGIRHLVADRLRRAKVDPIVRARLLGHATIQMHAHYSHEGVDELRDALTPTPAVAPVESGSRRAQAPSARSRKHARG